MPPAIGVVAAVMTASALILLPAAALTLPGSVPGAGPLAAVAGLGLVGTGAAFVIFYSLIALVGPAKTMLVSYIAPAFAVVYGATLLGEPLTAGKVVGLVLIVAGSRLGVGRAESPAAAGPSGAVTASADSYL